MSDRHLKPNMSKSEHLIPYCHPHPAAALFHFWVKGACCPYQPPFVWLSIDHWDPATLVEFLTFMCAVTG